jgi:hypothetical protein
MEKNGIVLQKKRGEYSGKNERENVNKENVKAGGQKKEKKYRSLEKNVRRNPGRDELIWMKRRM